MALPNVAGGASSNLLRLWMEQKGKWSLNVLSSTYDDKIPICSLFGISFFQDFEGFKQ